MIACPNLYDKIVIVCYPRGAGGKFLINNLGLNNQAVFQDSGLARLQINNNFSYDDKLAYIFNQFEKTSQNLRWNDLELGCGQLFGIDTVDYQTIYPEVLSTMFNTVVETIISKNLFLFVVAHDTLVLRKQLDFWVNAKVIGFTNFKNFINTRTSLRHTDKFKKIRSDYWNTIRDNSWPSTPPVTESEFLLLAGPIQHELINNFENEISRWFNREDQEIALFENDLFKIKNKLDSKFYQIDVDEFYRNEQAFLSTLKNCLHWLNLPMPVNEYDNVQYFQTWKNMLHTLNLLDQNNSSLDV
jgi:hypothetical protein